MTGTSAEEKFELKRIQVLQMIETDEMKQMKQKRLNEYETKRQEENEVINALRDIIGFDDRDDDEEDDWGDDW